jgi:hypothetical protein
MTMRRESFSKDIAKTNDERTILLKTNIRIYLRPLERKQRKSCVILCVVLRIIEDFNDIVRVIDFDDIVSHRWSGWFNCKYTKFELMQCECDFETQEF